jgi:hypothetical protein
VHESRMAGTMHAARTSSVGDFRGARLHAS